MLSVEGIRTQQKPTFCHCSPVTYASAPTSYCSSSLWPSQLVISNENSSQTFHADLELTRTSGATSGQPQAYTLKKYNAEENVYFIVLFEANYTLSGSLCLGYLCFSLLFYRSRMNASFKFLFPVSVGTVSVL
ncbi:hypothetical protein CPB83DRAFT_858533 [Crepidotus variabilis]|uniref:Uncharacterized protein n=1 Tax=Crepidotus variabilis TaxID=179855 RepID=A0A9P6EBH1_9AGAR|nr:hypothetical protein CPB83DRAFT_858533 [Crepidotus variabilis]